MSTRPADWRKKGLRNAVELGTRGHVQVFVFIARGADHIEFAGRGGLVALGAAALAGSAVIVNRRAQRAEAKYPPLDRFVSAGGTRLHFVDIVCPTAILAGNRDGIASFDEQPARLHATIKHSSLEVWSHDPPCRSGPERGGNRGYRGLGRILSAGGHGRVLLVGARISD